MTCADFNVIGYIISKFERFVFKSKFSEDDIEVPSTLAGRTIESVRYLTVHAGSEVYVLVPLS